MSLWMQDILVWLFVAACAGFVLWQMGSTLFGRKGRTGNCCARGCSTDDVGRKPRAERVVFLPAELLRKRR